MSGWPLRKLGDVATVTAGTSAPQDDKYFDGGQFNFVRTQDVGRYGFTTSLIETKDRVNELAIKEKRLKKARKGASIFPKSGASILTNSRAMLGCDSYIVSHLAIVDADQTLLDDHFLYYFLRTVDFGEFAQSEEDYPSLRLSDISELDIPIPPLAEQRRIVARIEKLTRRAEEARKLAADRETELDALLQALYSRMIEGVEWKTLVSIRSVVEEKETWNSRQDPRGQVEYLEISGIDNSLGRVIKTKTIPTSNPPSRAKKLIRVGDIVFGTTRPYLKNIAVIPENLDNQVCSTGFCVLRPQTDKVLTEWLFAICRSDLVVEQVTPGQEKHAYPAVSDDAVLDSFIPLPDVSEQRRIVARIEKLTRRVEKVRKLIAEAESQILQFQSALLAKAFRGEL